MSLKKFSIVQFPLKSGTVEVELVSSIWIDESNKNCSWPPHKGQSFKNFVKTCPEPQENWKKFPYDKILTSSGKELTKYFTL